MSRKPTMEDVKNLAGVSISTVSRVINGTRRVSPEKTEAVKRAIEKLGYKPNELARSLVMKRSNTLGIILDDVGYGYMAQYLRGIDEIGKMYKYDILLYSTFGDFETQKNAVEFLSSKQVEGIIVISEKINNEVLYLIKEHDIPYLLLDSYYNTDDYKTITIDYHSAASEITNYVIENNHKNIAFLRERSSSFALDTKENGYIDTIKKAGLRTNISYVNSDSIESGYEFMKENLDILRESNITAIIASSDNLAIGILHYCYDNDILIPEEFSITGFGNSDITALYRPALTTVRLPYYDIGAVGVRMLIKVIKEEGSLDESLSLHHEVIKRQTVKKI